jgi:hypothetical protein
MSIEERAMICGLTAIIDPENILEIGVFMAGDTHQLARFCKRLIAVDPIKAFQNNLPDNCIFMQIKSDEFFRANNINFDLIVIDADHSEEWAYKDLSNAIKFGKNILMHDTANLDCRKGYQNAIYHNIGKISYINLDMIKGCTYTDGILWGGIGLVVMK